MDNKLYTKLPVKCKLKPNTPHLRNPEVLAYKISGNTRHRKIRRKSTYKIAKDGASDGINTVENTFAVT